MRSLLAALALSLPMAHALVEVNTTELGQCFSPYVYNLILNAAFSGASIVEGAITNSTGFASNSSGVDPGDFRMQLELGNQVMTIITLAIIMLISVCLLILGEKLVNTLTILTTAITSFMAFLFLWQWACSSMVQPMEGFVKCILPFILAVLSAIIITVIVGILIKKFTSLVFFIMGAGGGAVGMFLLRQFIIAGNPQLASDWRFNFYWLGLAVVAILCGFLAVCLKRAVITTVTCILGGYGFAVALCGLIPACGGPYVANYVFFIVAGITMVLGAIFQCIFCKPDPDENARQDQYRADENARKEQAKRQKKGDDGVQFIAP